MTPTAFDGPIDKLVVAGFQIVTIALLSVGLTFAAGTLMGDATLQFGTPTGAWDTAVVTFIYLFPAAVGFSVGYPRCAHQKLWYGTARHVWALPLAFYGLLMGQGLSSYGVSDTVRSYFAPGGLLVIATMPVEACCGYSLGAITGNWRSSRKVVQERVS